MSEIEKQIAVLHELQCKAVENGFYGDIGLAETALQEKQEREKGCERCHTKGLVKIMVANGIKYCDNCGRKLGENDG